MEASGDGMINDLLRFSCDTLEERPAPSPELESAICYVKADKTWYGCNGTEWIVFAKGKK